MKAAVLQSPCSAMELTVSDVPLPTVKAGWVLIKIKAFGINRSEIYTRNGFSPSVKLPRIIGIECVGEVADPSDSELIKGQKVVSLMRGLGREFDGSYAEYCLIPSAQVYPVHWDLPWTILAAIPESYFTVYASLFDSLNLRHGEKLLIRGATSAAGQVALQLAKAAGATVYATTRNPEKATALLQAGADHCFIDDGQLSANPDIAVDKVLELVGSDTLRDSLRCLVRGGILCFTGILSGWIIDKFEPIEDIPNGVYLTAFHSDDVNADKIAALFDFIRRHNIEVPQPIIFPLSQISEAHALMESNRANGKIVITTEPI